MRGEKGDHFEGREVPGVCETGKNGVHVVLRLWDQANDGRDGLVGPAGQELELRSTLSEICKCRYRSLLSGITYRAVAERDRASELDEISGRDRRVLGEEWDKVVNRVRNTVVGREVGLDGGEKKHRAISSASTTNFRLQFQCGFNIRASYLR